MPAIRFSPALNRKVTLLPFIARTGAQRPRGLTYEAYANGLFPARGMVSLHELLTVAHPDSTAKSNDERLQPLVAPLQGYREGQRVRISTFTRRLIEVNVLAIKDLRTTRPFELEAPGTAAEWVENAAKHALAGLAGVEGVLGLMRHPDLLDSEKANVACGVFARKDYRLGQLFADQRAALLQEALVDPALQTFEKYLNLGFLIGRPTI